MKIGKYDFILRKKRNFPRQATKFTSKTKLCRWIMDNVDVKKTSRLVIDANTGECYIEENIV